jgi:nucleoside-diphosphate-sugar epimerase
MAKESMSELHVVIGSGNVGRILASKLALADKRVLLLSRSQAISVIPGVQQAEADASNFSSLVSAAPKADYIYNCVNPSRYDKWDVEWPPINQAVNQFAMRTGAVLVTSSNLYGYGPYVGTLKESLPLKAEFKNGRVRAEMWLEAKALHDSGKIRATEVRASDYICASDQSRMGDRVVPNLKNGKPIQLLGALDQLHTWTDPEDVAELMKVVATNERAWGKPWHVPSNEPKTQLAVVMDIAKELGVRDAKVSSVPTPIELLLGLFNPTLRELRKASYQFNRPFIMSDEKARTTFGLKPKPWDRIIKDLVAAYNL